ncbi:MAG TPA: hypothetical protein PLA54_13690, partial [Spirochaetota bacterium]|nr:hypothetical protein [Spirochaetota bacterium]
MLKKMKFIVFCPQAGRVSKAAGTISAKRCLKYTTVDCNQRPPNKPVHVSATPGQKRADIKGEAFDKNCKLRKPVLKSLKVFTKQNSMYFSYEKELEISTDKELDKTYAVSHIYLNGVRIAAPPALMPSLAAPDSCPSWTHKCRTANADI